MRTLTRRLPLKSIGFFFLFASIALFFLYHIKDGFPGVDAGFVKWFER
jgi:hypothetical protein